VAFGSHRKEKWGIYVKVADSTKNEEPVTESDAPIVPMTWTPDGQTLVYWTSAAKTQGDADERHPQVSPNGKWIAYSSSETGRSEIYVQPFPQGAKIQISSNGGIYPRWGRGGQELYFMNLISAGNLMVSNIRVAGAAIQRDDPKILFQTGFFTSPHAGGQYHAYAVSSDGQRLLIPQVDNPVAVFTGRGRGLGINQPAVMAALFADRHASTSSASGQAASINVVLNWTTAMKED
jgi:eukaryotic-like serine/threonine-protein kinase